MKGSCQEKNLLLTWQPEHFLTASPAGLNVTGAVETGDHCQSIYDEELCA